MRAGQEFKDALLLSQLNKLRRTPNEGKEDDNFLDRDTFKRELRDEDCDEDGNSNGLLSKISIDDSMLGGKEFSYKTLGQIQECDSDLSGSEKSPGAH